MEYRISVTGSGSPQAIIYALKELSDQLRAVLMEGKDFDGIEWEDPTLFTQIDILEEEVDDE